MGHFKYSGGKLVNKIDNNTNKNKKLTPKELAIKIHEIYENFTADDFKKDGYLKVDAVEKVLDINITSEQLKEAQPFLDTLSKDKK